MSHVMPPLVKCPACGLEQDHFVFEDGTVSCEKCWHEWMPRGKRTTRTAPSSPLFAALSEGGDAVCMVRKKEPA
jgi:uncharacterized Zn ribbon protein